MPTEWDRLAEEAGDLTDIQLSNRISGLSRFNDKEIETLIKETGITKVDLSVVLREVKDATKKNEDKAKAIQKIHKGVDLLVGLADKLL
jgi:hypothetical protein